MGPFFNKIHAWYYNNKRDLPWRLTKDPYKIWVSEIILQQTKIEQGINYYLRFIEKFPSVTELAKAKEEDVLKIWQGLGYYSRARNMYYAAQEVCRKYNSEFPGNYNELMQLKGIGPYTAAAIASISFNLPHATVDGNVYRFFSRFFGIYDPINTSKGVKKFQQLANEVLFTNNPGMHNQAMMEFGATICKAPNPLCQQCPVADQCFAYSKNEIKNLPVKLKKAKQQKRYFFYLFFQEGDTLFLNKRTANDIWQNLYEFPLIEMHQNLNAKEFLQSEEFSRMMKGSNFTVQEITQPIKHILSHQVIFATFIQIVLHKKNQAQKSFIQTNKKDIYKFAVPRLIENYLQGKGLI